MMCFAQQAEHVGRGSILRMGVAVVVQTCELEVERQAPCGLRSLQGEGGEGLDAIDTRERLLQGIAACEGLIAEGISVLQGTDGFCTIAAEHHLQAVGGVGHHIVRTYGID